jgi:outer membrane lipoprotein-sorting protein
MTRTFSNAILSSNRNFKFFLFASALLGCGCLSPGPAAAADRDRVWEVLRALKGHFQQLEDYSCEVEQTYFQNGEQAQRVLFTYHFRKDGRVRIDFSYPQSGATILYRKGEPKATVLPIRSLPGLRLQFSVRSSFLRTYTGQRLDQTDLGYFIDFLERSLGETRQPDFEFREERLFVVFWISGRDYLEGKTPEKYRLTLSRPIGLPLRIERYSQENIPIEKSLLRNYLLNTRPGDQFFLPR